MGRKSSAKAQAGPSAPVPPTSNGSSPFLLVAIVVAVVGVGVVAFWRVGPSEPAPSTPGAAASTPGQGAGSKANVTMEIEAAAAATAALGPHKQATLPPIPFQGYTPPRSPEVVTAAFEFAAEHPEIASYVPCFCGCEQMGHHGNHECFVKSRAQNGDVVEWEPHGVDCAVCIDVATRSRQMYASGASVRDIRAAIEKEFAPSFPSTHTPTPQPPPPRPRADQ